MSKKEKSKPHKEGNKWYLEGRNLDCHSCKYFARQEDIETSDDYMDGYDYCSLHRFKFKFDRSPGSDYSTCEHFTYKENSATVGSAGLLGKLISIAIGYFIVTRLFGLTEVGERITTLLIVAFITWLS